MSLEAVRVANALPGKVMRYCESCEVPIGRMDWKALRVRQYGDCSFCKRPLVRVERPADEDWLAVSNLRLVFRASESGIREALGCGEMTMKREGGATYVLVSQCEARWPRHKARKCQERKSK